MSKTEMKPYTEFALPSSVMSRSDISRLVTETERIDNELTVVGIRNKVIKTHHAAPAMTEQLTEFLDKNNIELTKSKTRSQLIKQLRLLKNNVPVVHMTFATAADPESLQQLTAWLRESVHAQAVITVGLQPALVAGVYLRTPNHVHDLSLRGKLKGRRDLLEKELEALRVGK